MKSVKLTDIVIQCRDLGRFERAVVVSKPGSYPSNLFRYNDFAKMNGGGGIGTVLEELN